MAGFLEETADLSLFSPTGPNAQQRDMTRGNRDVTNRFTGYYSNIDYKVKFGIPEPTSPNTLYLDIFKIVTFAAFAIS